MSNQAINVRFPEALKKKMKEMADLDKRSLNNLLVKIASDYVDKHDRTQPTAKRGKKAVA